MKGYYDLYLDIGLVDHETFEPEVDSEGGVIGVVELIIGESEKEGRLANSGVADDDNLE